MNSSYECVYAKMVKWSKQEAIRNIYTSFINNVRNIIYGDVQHKTHIIYVECNICNIESFCSRQNNE